MSIFKLSAEYEPQGDQPEAIKKLTNAFKSGEKYQTLMGVTGSGKTFTMANVIKALGKPTLVMQRIQGVLSGKRSRVFCKLL
jgi:excinuclease ABC subunit B